MQLHDLTALELAAAMRAREMSPVEVVQHYLERIERLDATLGAFITVTADRAREQAVAAERRIRSADDPRSLPPLLGVPVPIKDLNGVRGVRTTYGSAAFDAPAPVDDHVTALLAEGGTVMTGKTNTPEIGLPCYTENRIAPPARTPWDLSRSAGGSSGGAAAAVAAGLAPVAQGSDGGGSVRIPASVCGLVGLKVSRGRVSNGPVLGDLTGLGWIGPLARTVGDAAALLDVMAVPMTGDPHWAPPLPAGETFLAAVGREPGRLRIGRYRTPVIAEAPVAPECVEAYEKASALLAELGHEVEEVEPPFTAELVPMFERVWSVSAALAPVPAEREELLMPLTRYLRERGRALSAVQFAEAIAVMQSASRAAITATQEYDAVLTPTLAQLPSLVGGIRDDDDPAADFEAQKAFTPFTAPYNVTGQPAISLPLYRTGDLPVGIQLAGRPTGESTLLSLAAQLESAQPWGDRRPQLW